MRALVFSLVLQGSLPSIGTTIYGLIGFGVLLVGSILIVQSIHSWWRSRHAEKPRAREPLTESPVQVEAGASEDRPELTIVPIELKEHEKIREIQLVLHDGQVIRHEARLYYITVTNTGRRSLRVSARLNFDQHMIFVPLNKKPMFRVESKYDTEGFKRQVKTFGDEEAIAIALMSDERWESRHDVTIYPGPASETFVLFFTLKDFRVMTVPGGTRIYPNYDVGFPCKLPLGVCLVGDDLSPYCYVATFEVTAKNWKDFKVRQIGKTVRQPVP
jgi:hypothetical protein